MYRRYFRVDKDGFNTILRLIAPNIEKRDTNMRKSICPAERLGVTLRYLATG
ncbi:hypothetical protein LOTGIDRAFT_107819 [Lottia gigantea]|uniref:Uncharacterized protein n=1 Tax=Lottia gigantea TaxID=225164 RepID=V3ZSF4_LOTGI|nr:hypothetical protein LOTGIDRAFT_107819 [Lottia gigantea]ESO85490.1 hypothetical protein LOTGIDRAFT_107819 [Lottia gigantea]